MTKPAGQDLPDFRQALRRLAVFGGASIALFAGTVGAWTVATTLSGAVVTTGQFVVDGNVRKVQHPTGGVVGELLVREGARVERDAVLIRLDDTVIRANLQVITKQLDEFAARRGRLQAERDRRDGIVVTPELAGRLHEPDIAELVAAEQALFEARRASREGQKAQLTKRVGQLQDLITGHRAQQEARDRQAILIEEELLGVRGLYEKNLVSLSRKAVLEREAASLEGQKGQLLAAVAQAESRIGETQLQIIQIEDALREEAMKELREIQARSAELVERRVAAEDLLKRVEIRSPSAGFVHQLAVHTVGGVITPAEPVMMIVPVEDGLEVETRILPADIDQLAVGRAALVKVHAFNQRTTPELKGKVSRISADTSRDPQTGVAFYTIRVGVAPEELARLAPHRVGAGMQADVFVRTEDRTPLEYILKPLRDQIAKAFKER